MSRFCPKPCERYDVWTIAPEENCLSDNCPRG